MKKKKISIDLGTASMGVTITNVDDRGIPANIVFSKSYLWNETSIQGELKSKARRTARSLRRGIARKNSRYKKLVWVAESLLGVTKEELTSVDSNNLVSLRVKALQEKISLPELIRVLLWISKGRGVTYLTSSQGEVSKRIATVNEQMANIGATTLGELFYHRYLERKGLPDSSWKKVSVEGTFVHRDMIENEFNLIMDTQNRLHDNLFARKFMDILDEKRHSADTYIKQHFPTTKIAKKLKDIPIKEWTLQQLLYNVIFFQKAPSWKMDTIGICSIMSTQEEIENSLKKDYDYSNLLHRLCISKNLPIYEEFRTEALISNISIKKSFAKELDRAVSLTEPEKDIIRKLLAHNSEVSFSDIYKALGFPSTRRWFNIDTGAKTSVKGSSIVQAFEKLGLISEWQELNKLEQNVFIEFLTNIPNLEILLENEVSEVLPEYVYLSEGVSLEKLVEFMDILTKHKKFEYSNEGMKALGIKSADRTSYCREFMMLAVDELRKGKLLHEIEDTYRSNNVDFDTQFNGKGEIRPIYLLGSLRNPVIEVALNNFREIINSLAERYGCFDYAVIESTREFNSQKKKDALAKQQRAKFLEKKSIQEEFEVDSDLLVKKLRIAKNFNMKCPYTYRPIHLQNIHDFEIDHIVPRSLSNNNNFSNLCLVAREVNRQKGQRIPLEYLSAEGSIYKDNFNAYIIELSDWIENNSKNAKLKEVVAFKKTLLRNLTTEESTRQGFTARHLVQTGYINKLASRLIKDVIKYPTITMSAISSIDEETGEVLEESIETLDISKVRVTHAPSELVQYLKKEKLLGFQKNPHTRIPLGNVLAEIRVNEKRRLFSEYVTGSGKDNPDSREVSYEDFYHNPHIILDKRCDTRNHAVDSMILALVTPAMIQQAILFKEKYGQLRNGMDENGEVKSFIDILLEKKLVPWTDNTCYYFLEIVNYVTKNDLVSRKKLMYGPIDYSLFEDNLKGVRKYTDEKGSVTAMLSQRKTLRDLGTEGTKLKEEKLIKNIEKYVVSPYTKNCLLDSIRNRDKSQPIESFIDKILIGNNYVKKIICYAYGSGMLKFNKEVDYEKSPGIVAANKNYSCYDKYDKKLLTTRTFLQKITDYPKKSWIKFRNNNIVMANDEYRTEDENYYVVGFNYGENKIKLQSLIDVYSGYVFKKLELF